MFLCSLASISCAPRVTHMGSVEARAGTVVNLSMENLVGWPRVEIGGNIMDWPQLKLGPSTLPAGLSARPRLYIRNFAPLTQGVWTYVGRSHYDMGNLAEARKALERARSRTKHDHLAKLYLGSVLARDGDRQRGLKEIQAGLQGLNDWLYYLEQYHPDGRFWDPGRYLRSEIQRDLARLSSKDIRGPELISSAEMLGKKFEEEIDLAKRDQWDQETSEGRDDSRE